MEDKKAVIVFSFPEPDDSLELAAMIIETKKFFADRPNVKIHMAIDRSAERIVNMFDPEKQGESNLVEHAKRELVLAGNDDDFNESIIEAVRGFTSYGHSGGSASVAIPMLNDLLQFKNLTPLTDDPIEWNQVSEDVWQSCRNSEAFSNDGGKTYTLNSDQNKRIYHSNPHVKD